MITLRNSTADMFIPDGTDADQTLARTTHLGISAHQDDLEIMAIHGILECYEVPGKGFTGVVCTNGAGSPRAGVYAQYTDEQMQRVRRYEQRTAGMIGKYAAVLQLDYPSNVMKDPQAAPPKDDLVAILQATRPEVVYTHNPADKHPTHVGVLRAVLNAIRSLPDAERPKKLYGCEVWRDLDWLPDDRKTLLNVSGRDSLSAALLGVFDSQIAGGKRYDLATMGRRRANATYFESHSTDELESATYVIDLTPLMLDDSLCLADYTAGLIDAFRAAVVKNLA